MSDFPPYPRRSLGAALADAGRVVTLLGAVPAVFFWGLPKVAAFLAAFGLLVIVRRMRIPAPFDAAFVWALFIATVTGAVGWYESVPWSDKPVHFLTTGTAAAAAYLILTRCGMVEDLFDSPQGRRGPRLLLQTTSLGLSIAVIWEFLEWFYDSFEPHHMGATYFDTMGDLASGAVGSLLAGAVLILWARGVGRTSTTAAPHMVNR